MAQRVFESLSVDTGRVGMGMPGLLLGTGFFEHVFIWGQFYLSYEKLVFANLKEKYGDKSSNTL